MNLNSILIVDDEEPIRKVYKSIFQRKNYLVVTASNAIEARKYLKAVKIDLILLDINMGEVQGDILYEIMQCFHPDIKVIVSSVYPVEEQEVIIPQADAYFDKSEGTKVLLEKVQQISNRFSPSNEKVVHVT